MKHLAAVLAVAGLVTAPQSARSEDTQQPVDRTIHIPLILAGATAYVLGETVLKSSLSPETCRWCEPLGVDESVRDSLLWTDTDLAHQLSNASGFVAAPIVALGGIALASTIDQRQGVVVDDALIIAESAVLAGTVNYVIKALVGRERPFVHALPEAQKSRTEHPDDNNLSFYSGHSALSMSLATSAATVAFQRGYRAAPILLATGVGLSLTTGYLRIAADKHWATDVVTGWLTGAAIGYWIPRLHRKGGSEVTPLATTRTIGVAMRW